MRPSHSPIPTAPVMPGSTQGGRLQRVRGVRLQRAALLIIQGLMLAACTHDWDAYDPRIDSVSGGTGGTGGGGTSSTSSTSGSGGGSCDDGFTQCDGSCVDTQSDAQHCGSCDIACAVDEICSMSDCELSCESLADCGGLCVDTAADPGHCGGCGDACGPGAGCSMSQCTCSGSDTYCGSTTGCVDTASDPQNCNDCDVVCDVDEQCVSGACETICGMGETYCSGSCVDTSVDPAHCGGCDAVCGTGDVCAAGDCTCPAPVCGLCGVQGLGSAVPQTINGDTSTAPDNFDLSCVLPGAGEVVFAFTAPLSGPYSIDAFGSSYDVALAVIDQTCSEVECNDDTLQTDSQIVMDLDANQTVLVVVDGYEGSEGGFALHIQSAVCPLASLGSNLPETMSGATDNLGNILSPSCGDPGSPEATYGFIAPADGMYTFDTLGSTFDTVLHIHDGDCFGPELGCDDDAVGGQSVVTLALTAGQAVVVAVDGFGGVAGDYTLNVN